MSNVPANVDDWLPDMLGPVELQSDGTPLPARANLNFGPNLTAHVEDDGLTLTIDGIPSAGASLPKTEALTSKTANYAIVPATDYCVSFTTGGHTLKLPGATLARTPGSGESYIARAAPGTHNDIDGDGFNIDGAGTYTQSDGETTTLRFNATAGQWEVW